MLITYHSLIRGFSRGSQGRNRGNSVFFWLRRVSLPPLGFLAHLSSGSVGTKPPQNHPPTHPPPSHPPSPPTEGGGLEGRLIRPVEHVLQSLSPSPGPRRSRMPRPSCPGSLRTPRRATGAAAPGAWKAARRRAGGPGGGGVQTLRGLRWTGENERNRVPDMVNNLPG